MSDEEIQCPVCGYYCLGNGGRGCIDKPAMMGVKKEDPQKAKDHAVCMAYDAFSLCMGNKPAHSSTTVMDVVRWLECVWHVDVREYLNRAAASPSPSSPHEYKPHKKYPWFCRDCGYPPQDEVKHIQHPDWTPAAFLNTCGCEPMKEETKEALAAMITAAGDMMKPNDSTVPPRRAAQDDR